MPLVHIIAKSTMTSVSIRELFAVFYFHREIHTALDSELHVSYRYYCFYIRCHYTTPIITHLGTQEFSHVPAVFYENEPILMKFPRSKQALKIVIFL
jgi:hypothetical protein